MKRTGMNIIRKIQSRSGMTMVEMLCATLILLLVSGSMASGITLAVKQYSASMRNSESQVLYSTLKTMLENELAYTTDIRVESLENGIVKQFQSQNYAIEESLSTIMTDKPVESGYDYGQILLGDCTNPEKSMRILGKAAYTNGLLAKVTSITYSNTTHYFTVYLSIGYNGEEYYGGEFQVKNVNETEATVS